MGLDALTAVTPSDRRRARPAVLNVRFMFIVVLSQVSLAMYLMDSFAINRGTEAQHAIVYAGECITWVLLAMVSVLLYGRRVGKREYDLLVIAIVLFLIGLVVGRQPFESMRVLSQTIAYFCIVRYIATCSLAENLRILRAVLVTSLCVQMSFDVFNQVVKGNTLLQLGLIQIPLWVFGTLIVSLEAGKNRLLLALMGIFFLLLYLDVLAGHGDPELIRLQYLPLGLSVMILMGFALGVVLRSTAARVAIATMGLTLFTVYFSLISDIFVFESRLGSFTERIYLLGMMWRESFYSLVPQGFGASFRIYDLGSYNLNLGYRVLYPPHSGIAVLFYEYSAIGLMICGYFAWQIIRGALTSSLEKETAARMVSGESPLRMRGCDSRLARHLLILLGVFWLLQNIFYLKGVITADNFSDDGILIFASIALILYRLIIRPPATGLR
ncbi:hypothetical protein EBR44_03425 [bacterium]|nr:hypothetical protein [bacterium]